MPRTVNTSPNGPTQTDRGYDVTLWQELGLPEPRFEDERTAPAVDRDLLGRLVRKELSEDASRDVYRLIVSYASWRDAHAQVVANEYRRQHGS